LLRFADHVDTDRHGEPAVLGVVTSAGHVGRREDGVHVIPVTVLLKLIDISGAEPARLLLGLTDRRCGPTPTFSQAGSPGAGLSNERCNRG
jgi:hypothetical protein